MDADWEVSLVMQKFQALLVDEASAMPIKLRNQVQRATDTLRLLYQSLKDAKTEEVQMVKIIRALYSAEDSVDTFLARSRRYLPTVATQTCQPFVFSLMDSWVQFLFSHEMKKFVEEIRGFVGDDHNISGSNLQDGNGQGLIRDDRLFKEDDEVVGFQEEIRELVGRIIPENGANEGATEVISVVGESGSGKTVLTKDVYEQVRTKQHFKNRAWVNVSNRLFNVRDIAFDVLKQLDQMVAQAEEPILEHDVVSRLGNILQQGRYLIVVDNVGSPDVWERLRTVFLYPNNGSRIVVTTRSVDVAALASSTLRVGRLSNEESWELFLKKVRKTENSLSSNSNLVTFKEQILNLCGGLPVGIVLIGSLLSMKESNEGEWSRVIERANNLSADINIITLSYLELPSWMKPCFLYMGLFPQAYEIPVRRLIHLWTAERLVKPMSSTAISPEDLATMCLTELINRNLIEVPKWKSSGMPKTCRMPSVIYNLFSTRAENMGLFFIHGKSHYANQDQPQFTVRRLASYTGIKKFSRSDCYSTRYLRSYISLNIQRGGMPAGELGKFLNKIIQRRETGMLTVLDLEGVYKPRLPTALRKLVNLRYIGLRSTALDSLPDSIGHLPSLETIDVKYTFITTLPNSIWMAKHLRHLYMDWINFDSMFSHMPSNSVPSSHLQTISGLSIGNESPVLNIVNKLTCIRKLGLMFSSTNQDPISNWLSQLTNLQSLKLRSIRNSGQRGSIKWRDMANHQKLMDLYLLGLLPRPIDVKLLPPNLKMLTLSMSQLRKDPMPMLGKLSQLNVLRLFADSYLGETLACHSGGFPQLNVLKLWKLVDLKEWTVEEGAMPCLKELEIRGCKRLERLRGLQQLTSLKELELTNMPSQFMKAVKEDTSTNVFIKENDWAPRPLQA